MALKKQSRLLLLLELLLDGLLLLLFIPQALMLGCLLVYGYIPVPDAPGLGIDVDEALARAHPYTGDGLHLEMQEAPCSYTDENVFGGGAPVQNAPAKD